MLHFVIVLSVALILLVVFFWSVAKPAQRSDIEQLAKHKLTQPIQAKNQP